jgi:hypothetical protein
MCGQLHAPASLLPGKQPPYQLYRRLGGPQSQSERYGEKKDLLSLPRIEPRLVICPALSLVAIPIELSRLVKALHMEIKMSKERGASYFVFFTECSDF